MNATEVTAQDFRYDAFISYSRKIVTSRDG